MKSPSPIALVLALVLAGCATASDPAPTLADRLESITRDAVQTEPLAGVSVAILKGDEVLFRRSYGFADIGLGVPATDSTTYRVLGPPIAIAVMQQVEAGRLRLEDDASELLPDFPWQGRRVTIRQLMDATSGLPDFHYLGDTHLAQRAVPKAPDEVTALVAGRPFLHEPGERSQWTITGLHLAGVLVERLTGQPFADYTRQNIIARAGLERSYHCDDRTIVPGLARAYGRGKDGFQHAALESASLYPYIQTFCASALDAASIMRALRDGRLMRAETYELMTRPEGAALSNSPANPSRGIGIRVAQEEQFRWVGASGSLMGFSSALMDFPAESLTIAVLSNTGGQSAAQLGRNLARAVLNLPLLPPANRGQLKAAESVALPPEAHSRYIGVYRTGWAGNAGRFQNWQRTYRVFADNGKLMLQALGDEAEPLLHQGDHKFRIASWPSATLEFTVTDNRATAFGITGGEMTLRGPRIGDEPRWP